MQLSQDDQRTIAGLRHEFEKAWKIVEVSQDRENKSRDVIDTMRVEISNSSEFTGIRIPLTSIPGLFECRRFFARSRLILAPRSLQK
jgi:hypothetical protein